MDKPPITSNADFERLRPSMAGLDLGAVTNDEQKPRATEDEIELKRAENYANAVNIANSLKAEAELLQKKLEEQDDAEGLKALGEVQSLIGEIPAAANDPDKLANIQRQLEALSKASPQVQGIAAAAAAQAGSLYDAARAIQEFATGVISTLGAAASTVKGWFTSDMSSTSRDFLKDLESKKTELNVDGQTVDNKTLQRDFKAIHNKVEDEKGKTGQFQLLETTDQTGTGSLSVQLTRMEKEAGKLEQSVDNLLRLKDQITGKGDSNKEVNAKIREGLKKRVDDIIAKQKRLIELEEMGLQGSDEEKKLKKELNEAKAQLKTYLKETVAGVISGKPSSGISAGSAVDKASAPVVSSETSRPVDMSEKDQNFR